MRFLSRSTGARKRGKARRRRVGGSDALRRAMLGQIQAAHEGTEIAQQMLEGLDTATARNEIADAERRGDQQRAALVTGLASTLVTPLDREDLFRVSRAIDEVLDTLQDFVREADLYHIENREAYLPLVAKANTALGLLEEAVDSLWTNPGEVPSRSLAVRKAARTVTREYRTEFARTVVNASDTADTLKHRELIKRLDWLGVRIREAADALTDGALKRGY